MHRARSISVSHSLLMTNYPSLNARDALCLSLIQSVVLAYRKRCVTNECCLYAAAIVIITAVLLIGLFLLQRFGTSKVGFLFSPVVVIWFVTTAMVGVYNVVVHNPTIFKAVSPHYIFMFFSRRGKEGWKALAGTVLCITSKCSLS